MQEKEERRNMRERPKDTKDLSREPLPVRPSDIEPKTAIPTIKWMIKRLNKEQKRDRKDLAAMLKVLEGNPNFTGEERTQFAHALNELLDRLGMALFLPDSNDPVRLAIKNDRGKVYFRLTRNGKTMRGSPSLWKLQLKRKPPSKLRKS